MAQLAFENEAEVKAALADVRNDATETNWCLVAYPDDNPTTVVFVGSGSGGVNELVDHLVPTTCYYGLVRVTEVIDQSVTVKFCFIKYLGKEIKTMFKAKITVHQGFMQEKFKPYHVELLADSPDEISEEIIMKLVSDASMSKSKVVAREHPNAISTYSSGKTTPAASSVKQQQQSNVPSSMGNVNLFQGTEEELKEAIADVRNDKTETDWALAAYLDEGKTTIGLVAKGTGGAEGLITQLTNDNIYYGIIRTTDVIDKSVTVKFVFVHFLGDGVKPMARAKTSTHKGVVVSKFSPFHVDLTTSKIDEINSDAINKLVGENSNSKSKVIYKDGEQPIQRSERSEVVKEPVRQNVNAVNASVPTAATSNITKPKSFGSNVFEFVDLDQIKAAIADVRNDKADSDWCLCGYVDESGARVGLIGHGTGGADAMKELFTDSVIYYGLVRTIDIVDNNVTVKFCFVTYQSDNVKLGVKAKAATHKGNITKLLLPYHVELFASTLNEVSNDIIANLVSTTSMSSSRAIGGNSNSAGAAAASSGARVKPVGGSSSAGGALEFVNDADIKEAIGEVRRGPDYDWCLVSYINDAATQLALVAKGDGGADTLASQLNDDQVAYGIVRVVDLVDNHPTVKFAFIHYLGPKCKAMTKAKTSTHKGQVHAFFTPFHVELFSESKEGITSEAVNKLVQDASMTANKVMNDKPAPKAQPAAVSTPTKSTPAAVSASPVASPAARRPVASSPAPSPAKSSGAALDFDPSVKETIADVRHDGTETNWVLIGYADKAKLNVVASGSGGADELAQHLDVSQVLYGLVRVVEIIDASTTIKFVLITWLGDKVSPMTKARISTHKGAIEAALHPYHVALFATNASEVNEAAVKLLVGKTSMAHSNVK